MPEYSSLPVRSTLFEWSMYCCFYFDTGFLALVFADEAEPLDAPPTCFLPGWLDPAPNKLVNISAISGSWF